VCGYYKSDSLFLLCTTRGLQLDSHHGAGYGNADIAPGATRRGTRSTDCRAEQGDTCQAGKHSDETNIFDKHLALESEIVGSPLVTGNKVELLIDGPAAYDAMFAAIEGAHLFRPLTVSGSFVAQH